MVNAQAVLALLGSIVAALAATILIGPAIALASLFAIGCGIFLFFLQREGKWMLIEAVVCTVFGLLSMLGALGSISTQSGTLDFEWAAGIAVAFAIVACLSIVGSLIQHHWDGIPDVGAYISLAALAAAVVLAFIFNGQLASSEQESAVPLVIAILSLVGIYPAIVLRNEEP